MNQESDTLAILFADIARSTRLYDSLGDRIAKNHIDACLSILTKVTLHHQGTVVKTIGDELMCTFPTALNAVEAAIDMQKAIEGMQIVDKPDVTPSNIYVGIQIGPVIIEEGDVFGDAVNVAARMVALAKQRQIITTEETVNALPPGHGVDIKWIDKTTVRGKEGEVPIYEVIWEQQEITVMVDDFIDPATIEASLELRFQEHVIKVDNNRPVATLGRQIHNDLVVDSRPVSRSHARIEYQRGKFVLIDQSSNGTFVLLQGKKSVTLKRDLVQLLGNGIIGLGQEVDPDSPDMVHFVIEHQALEPWFTFDSSE